MMVMLLIRSLVPDSFYMTNKLTFSFLNMFEMMKKNPRISQGHSSV